MFSRRLAVWIAAVTSLAAAGCAKQLALGPSANQPPVVRLEPSGAPSGASDDVTHLLRWTAVDSDGRVDHFLVAVRPRAIPAADDTWQTTDQHSYLVHVRRSAPLAVLPAPARVVAEPTVVAVRAVDDRGAVSVPALRAYFGENVAPSVAIVSPRPTRNETLVPSSFRIRWSGSDPDGPDGRPAKYKFRLFSDGDPDLSLDDARARPDLLNQRFAPAFAGWDSLPGESLQVILSGLVPGRHYLFAITALDAEGGYDPLFGPDKNLLFLTVGFDEAIGPLLTLYNEFFNYRFPAAFFGGDSSVLVHLECPPRVPITFRWTADPPTGAGIAGYRWVLDPVSLEDSRPRRNERIDVHRWSRWSLGTTSATVGPFFGRQADLEHTIYIEARDDFDRVSRASVRFHIVQARYDRPLLIVDDTRLRPDQFTPDGTLIPPLGAWPNAAELDTFLFARGGTPWTGYPAGFVTPPGVFAGYDFDTLGTRTGQVDLTVPLELLLRYRQVVWITDAVGASYGSPGTSATTPMTSLRYMTAPGRENTLAAYVERGGKLWIAGGGAGLASSAPGPFGELDPGRFMYDIVHWRSPFQHRVLPFPQLLTRSPPPIGDDHAATMFSMLPMVIERKTLVTDPLPPLRTETSVYARDFPLEMLVEPNAIVEDAIRHCRDASGRSTLDTLYVLAGPGPDLRPVMTYYHGRDNGSVVFTGFDLWSWRRSETVAVAGAVLNGLWGLSRRMEAVSWQPTAGGTRWPGDHAPVDR